MVNPITNGETPRSRGEADAPNTNRSKPHTGSVANTRAYENCFEVRAKLERKSLFIQQLDDRTPRSGS